MFFLILLAIVAVVLIFGTLLLVHTDGYRRVPDRPGTVPFERR